MKSQLLSFFTVNFYSSALSSFKQNKLLLLCGLFAALMLIFPAIGTWYAYTPIPISDMWGGVVDFLYQVDSGNHSVWWGQFVDHRIVLSRALFWVDARLFGGNFISLFIANYALICASVALFWCFLRSSVGIRKLSTEEILFGLVLTGWLFLWTQQQNLTWGFQNQFILAQLVPLCGFYALHKSTHQRAGTAYFALACCLGVLSAGTMANGVLALPLMVLYALIARLSWQRIGVLTTLTVLTIYLYFHDYQSSTPQTPPLEELLKNPAGIAEFVLMFLGNPFYFLFGKWVTGWIIAMAAGLGFIVLSLRFTIVRFSQLRNVTESPDLALLMFIGFIGATGFVIGCGREQFGMEWALISRYSTPALMAWAALAILYRPQLALVLTLQKRHYKYLFGVVMLAMFVVQISALKPLGREIFERKVGVLALELGVHDEQQVEFIFPYPDWLIGRVENFRSTNLSVFGHYPYHGARAFLGAAVKRDNAGATLGEIKGHLEHIARMSGAASFYKVSGWIELAQKPAPQAIFLIDANNVIAGYALVDPKPTESEQGRRQFEGYVKSDQKIDTADDVNQGRFWYRGRPED